MIFFRWVKKVNMSNPPLTSVLLAGVNENVRGETTMYCVAPVAKGQGSGQQEYKFVTCDQAASSKAVWTVQPNGSIINPITGNPLSSQSNFQTSAGGDTFPYQAFCAAGQGPYQTYGMVSDPSKPRNSLCAVINSANGEIMNWPCVSPQQTNSNICALDPNNL